MAIAIPLVIVTVATSGTSTIVTAPALVGVMAPSIATLGGGATFSAVSIAAGATIAAGGVSKISAGVAGLGKLRHYKITKNGNGITLKRK